MPVLFLSSCDLIDAAGASALARRGAARPRQSALLIVASDWATSQHCAAPAAPEDDASELTSRAQAQVRMRGHVIHLIEPREPSALAALATARLGLPTDIPSAQLSIAPLMSSRRHFMLGRALRPLVAEGALLLALGDATSNLAAWEERGERAAEAGPVPWAAEFNGWLAQRLAAGDLESLFAFQRVGPHARRNHAVDDHLLPLFVALGAAPAGWPWRRLAEGWSRGVLATDVWGCGVE